MSKTTSLGRALDVIGDSWSHLIVKEAFLGTTRFQDFQKRLGIPKQTLMVRLTRLTEAAIFYKSPIYNRRLLFEYRLTAKGLDLYPIALTVWWWHRQWHLDPKKLPENLVHKQCRQPVMPRINCRSCQEEVQVGSVEVRDILEGKSENVVEKSRRTRIANELAAQGDAHLATLLLGDAWNMLILDAAMRGISQFHEIQDDLGISSNVLSARLKPLVHLGVLNVSVSSEDKRTKNYLMTDKSRDIYAVVLMITSWGDRWLAGSEGPPQLFIHKPCGNYVTYQMVCGYCDHRIGARDISQVSRV